MMNRQHENSHYSNDGQEQNTKETAKRAVTYACIAVEQESGASYGLEAQINAGKTYCEEHGYHLQHIYQEQN